MLIVKTHHTTHCGVKSIKKPVVVSLIACKSTTYVYSSHCYGHVGIKKNSLTSMYVCINTNINANGNNNFLARAIIIMVQIKPMLSTYNTKMTFFLLSANNYMQFRTRTTATTTTSRIINVLVVV